MIDATYFDGCSARRHPVKLIVHKGTAAILGEGITRSMQLAKLDISERLQHAPRLLRFPDGGFIEARDHKRLDKMLAENGYRTPRTVRWQNNWPLSLLALGLLISTLVATYQWGVPAAADRLAQHLPATIEQTMGEQTEASMNKHLARSRMPAAEQARLRSLFATLRQPHGDKTPYRLEFRSSPMGPNAFALPNGVIVMTDELVWTANNDDAVLGVLSHELGHVQRRHAARNVLQALGMGALLNLWLGDVSGAMAAVPGILLAQKHSRDFEREADQYAIEMMLANGRPLAPLAALFERMGSHAARPDDDAAAEGDAAPDSQDDGANGEKQDEEDGGDENPMRDYLSSHPSDAERIARLRQASVKK